MFDLVLNEPLLLPNYGQKTVVHLDSNQENKSYKKQNRNIIYENKSLKITKIHGFFNFGKVKSGQSLPL